MPINQTKAGEKHSANRLIEEVSTYLRQHAFNPVDWYPWGNEALNLAIATNKPIMLSIGYSACHWCHVMEEESFEDEATAKLINDHFIPIKVDREERPDIDDIYMTAVQMMTGHGGWPLTVFLTPQQKPFYGGTYFPSEDRSHGNHVLPGFKTVLESISHAWEVNRADIEANGDELTNAISSIAEQQINSSNLASADKSLDANFLIECAKKILPLFDLNWGGIGRAPKFPQTLCLQMCLQASTKLKAQKDNQTAEQLLKAVVISLERMAQGGMYDHLAGGFARYSTDERWLIPHFEKMLYDNALLAEIYLDAFTLEKREFWKTVACETLDFMATELLSEEGGFYSSLDADSEGVEGKFYVWQKSEIDKVLQDKSEDFSKFFGITEIGNFENKENILNTTDNKHFDEQSNEIMASKAKLLTNRNQRIHPIRDEKILTSWTSLALSAFTKGYRITGNEKYLSLAKEGVHFILSKLVTGGKLKRSYARGTAKLDAYLDDYAFFCKALIDLASVDPDPAWLEYALQYGDLLIELFFDEESQDFYYTATDHEKLITRPKNYFDGPIPSATSIAIRCLVTLYKITNDSKYKTAGQNVLDRYQGFFRKHPSQFASMISTLETFDESTLSLVLVNSSKSESNKAMLLAAHNSYMPAAAIFVKDNNKTYNPRLLLFNEKNAINDSSSAYICQNYSCQPAITNCMELQSKLANY